MKNFYTLICLISLDIVCHSAPQFKNYGSGQNCEEFQVIGGSSKTEGIYERHGNSGDLVWKKPGEDRFIFNKEDDSKGWRIGRDGHRETAAGSTSYFKSSKQNLPNAEKTWTSSSNGEVTVRCNTVSQQAAPAVASEARVIFERGCAGKLSLFQGETLLEDINFVDVKGVESTTIRRNRINNNLRIDSVKATGDCCWEVESNEGDFEEVHPEEFFATDISNSFYIHKIFAYDDCPEY